MKEFNLNSPAIIKVQQIKWVEQISQADQCCACVKGGTVWKCAGISHVSLIELSCLQIVF